MTINEVFPNPTVKQVIFQVRFPSLFSIENKIGDFQENIIDKFPESSLLHRQQVLVTEVGPNGKVTKPPPDLGEGVIKIWQFRSPKRYTLNVLFGSLDINSEYHKTYNNRESRDKFRDIIEFVLDSFTELFKLPKFTRVGLRYRDECPVPQKENEAFKEYYNSVFPLDRFRLEDIEEMVSRTVSKKGDYYIMYAESFIRSGKKWIYGLDFDGFANNVASTECLSVTDKLHDIISEEYEKTIRAPVIEYMRQPKGGN